MMERMGQWLAGWTADGKIGMPDVDERIEAVVERVKGLETRVRDLEKKDNGRSDERP